MNFASIRSCVGANKLALNQYVVPAVRATKQWTRGTAVPAVSKAAEATVRAIDHGCNKVNYGTMSFLKKYPGIALTLSPGAVIKSVAVKHAGQMMEASDPTEALAGIDLEEFKRDLIELEGHMRRAVGEQPATEQPPVEPTPVGRCVIRTRAELDAVGLPVGGFAFYAVVERGNRQSVYGMTRAQAAELMAAIGPQGTFTSAYLQTLQFMGEK